MNNQCKLAGSLTVVCMIFSYDVHAKDTLPGTTVLEEVVVTAQKRTQSMQDIPIAISVLNKTQLDTLGVTSLEDLRSGVIPSLRIDPHSNSSSTLAIAIRGNGPVDIVQATRESSVAIYQDGIYLGRAQGLAMDLADLERIEVLRGPQGTLFGRNATSGAISLVSQKPTGEFAVKQTVGLGSYDEIRSVTRVNLPEVAGVSAKIDYLHQERDGWVNNTAPGEADYNESEKNGGRLSLHWQANDNASVDYTYDKSKIESSQVYFQLYEDKTGLIGEERERETTTRFPIPLNPSEVNVDAHALTASWTINSNLSVKSLSSYRELEDNTSNNYAGVLANNGLILLEDTDQEQYTQEFQIIGSSEQLEWTAGLYYFKEKVQQDISVFFSLENDLSPIDPPTTVVPGTAFDIPTNFTNSTAKSLAAYGQGTWTLDNLHLTFGTRYTKDDKSGNKLHFIAQDFDFDSENLDASIALQYDLSTHVSSYVKWGSAYRAGGVNVRSETFASFDKEEVQTWEIGLKSELWNNRIRLNAAIFSSDYDDMQFDFVNPDNVTINETLNAIETVEIDGFELDLTLTPLEGLIVGVSYTYLDADMPIQPNPLDPSLLQNFSVTQTPKHAGSLMLDYAFAPFSFGTLSAHVDITSTDRFNFVSLSSPHQDSYTLFNTRLTLADIDLGLGGALSISAWGKNLTDEEYLVLTYPIQNPSITTIQAFGTPRTAGIDITYQI